VCSLRGKNRSLNAIQFNFCLQSTEKARVRSQVTPHGPYGGRSSNGTGFSPNTAVLPCQCHSTNTPYSSPFCSYQKGKRAKPVDFWNSRTLWRKVLFFSFFLRLYRVNGDVSGTDHTPQLRLDELLPSQINTFKKQDMLNREQWRTEHTTYLFTKYIRHENQIAW